MGDRLEARISAIENIQKEFGHDIREMREQLVRLTNFFEDHIQNEAVHPRGPSPFPNRQVPRPFVQTTSYLPCETNHPNLQQPMPIAPPTFRTISRPVDRPNSSKGKPNEQKIDKNKPLWDPIPITYTKLFPKLVEIGHIEPFQLAPLKPPFPIWYNAHVRYDYHSGNPGHSTENCTALKLKVRDLINEGKLKFEESDGANWS